MDLGVIDFKKAESQPGLKDDSQLPHHAGTSKLLQFERPGIK